MAKFIFELEAVLKQRLAVEREKKLAVGALERERAEIEEGIRLYQGDLVRERQELRDQLSTAKGAAVLDLRGVRFQAGAALRLITLAQRAVLRLAGVHRKLDAARLELLEATTRRKAVETLKERRFEEWRHEQKRKEAAAADELNVILAARSEGNE
jgi:flagellar export protein FliJ